MREMKHSHVKKQWERGCKFLQTDLAIMGGAMTWLSEHRLVAAISQHGGFGVLACGALLPQQLSQEIQQTRLLTSDFFGVNLICMHPQLDALIEVCGDWKVSYIVLAGGIPSASLIQTIKRFQAKVLCFAPTLNIAKRLIRLGVDALIIEGMEAGGHVGAVTTSVLAQEILPHIHEVPVFVAGGIGRGEAITAYLEQGASGVQMGTRFVCAMECIAHRDFKRVCIRASARDAVISVQLDERFPVIPVRALSNQAMKHFMHHQREVIELYESDRITLQQAQLDIEHFWAGALRRAVIEGDVENGSLMAGQSVGFVHKEQSMRDILGEILEQTGDLLC